MPRMSRKIAIIATIAIQAPARNLVTSTMTRTVAVMPRPIELTVLDRFIRARWAGSCSVLRCRFQCRIMPSWLRLNETNTPTM